MVHALPALRLVATTDASGLAPTADRFVKHPDASVASRYNRPGSQLIRRRMLISIVIETVSCSAELR